MKNKKYYCNSEKREIKISTEKPRNFSSLLKNKSFTAPNSKIAKQVYQTHLTLTKEN